MQTNVSCKTPGNISKMMKSAMMRAYSASVGIGGKIQGPGVVGTAVWEAEERLWEGGTRSLAAGGGGRAGPGSGSTLTYVCSCFRP